MDTCVAFLTVMLKVILILIFTNSFTVTYIQVLTEVTYHRMSSSQKWQSGST